MKLFSTKEAAEELGLSVQSVKYHIYVSKRLSPQNVAGQLVFTEDDLTQFKAWQAEKAAIVALPPEEKKARHRDQQAAYMRRRWRETNS